MDKDKFLKVFNNHVLFQLIFENVNYIFISVKKNNSYQILKWNHILDRPDVLVSYNYIQLLKDYYSRNIFKTFSGKWDKDIRAILNTIKYNQLDILMYLIEDVFKDNIAAVKKLYQIDLLEMASQIGSLEIVKYLDSLAQKNKLITWNYNDAFFISPLSGKLDICKWLSKQYIHSENKNENVFQLIPKKHHSLVSLNAVIVGNIDILKWVLNFFKERNIDDYIEPNIWNSAIQSENIKLLDNLYELEEIRSLFLRENLLDAAILDCNIETLNWLASKKAKYSIHLLMYNAFLGKGGLKNIQWLHDFLSNPEDLTDMVDLPNYVYHKDMAVWFDTNIKTLLMIDNLMSLAIIEGKLEIVQWLHKSLPDLECSIDGAFTRQNLEMLKWLNENRTEKCSPAIKNRFYSFKKDIKVYILDHIPSAVPSDIFSRVEDEWLFEYIIKNHPQHIQANTITYAQSNRFNNCVELLNQITSKKRPLSESENI